MKKRSTPTTQPDTAPYIPFMDSIPVDQARDGDMVAFFNRNGKLHGYRLGWVVKAKKLSPDKLMVRMKLPGDRLGTSQQINRKDVLHAYRETVMEDPTDEVT